MSEILPLKTEYENSIKLGTFPMLVYYDNYLTDSECAHIIKIAEKDIKRAPVSLDDGPSLSDTRTGGHCWLQNKKDLVVQGLVNRISKTVGLPKENAELLQVIHYDIGQEFKPHFDAFDLTNEKMRQYCERGGQRVLTALIYLNDVLKGGSTVFPEMGEEVKAKKGRLAIFHNCLPNSLDPHPFSMHGGAPVELGFKWACNLWYHNRPFDEIQTFDDSEK